LTVDIRRSRTEELANGRVERIAARYYERAAYEHVGDVTVDEYVHSRYEKRVGDVIA